MKKTIGFILLLFMLFVDGMNAQTKDNYPANYARAPRFKALIYYTTYAEEAHVQFAEQATDFFKKLNYGDGFILDKEDAEYGGRRGRRWSCPEYH